MRFTHGLVNLICVIGLSGCASAPKAVEQTPAEEAHDFMEQQQDERIEALSAEILDIRQAIVTITEVLRDTLVEMKQRVSVDKGENGVTPEARHTEEE